MGTVTVITRRGPEVLGAQEVDEDLVPAILNHIEEHHAHEGITVSVVPVGFSRFIG
jgi:hypothetical protein